LKPIIDVTILCVSFNSFICDSVTIRTFLKEKNNIALNNSKMRVVVWDNSTESKYIEDNKLFARDNNISIFGDGVNHSLGWVYNIFLNDIKVDFLCLFDDDSNITRNYLIEVDSVVLDSDISVAIPKVFSQQGSMYSPAKLGIVRGIHLDKINTGFHYGLTAITSGTLLNVRNLKSSQVFFDESLSFYGVDTLFFLVLKAKKIPVYVFEAEMHHNLSFFNEEPYEVKKFRAKNLKSSNIYLAKKRGLFFYLLSILYWNLFELKEIVSRIFRMLTF
jgi:hypothetical protein